VGKDSILRKHVEELFPNANGEEVSMIMELLLVASDAEQNIGETAE
jgi:hypothetical protein